MSCTNASWLLAIFVFAAPIDGFAEPAPPVAQQGATAGVASLSDLESRVQRSIEALDWSQAVVLLDQVLQLKPDDTESMLVAGYALRKLGLYEEAISKTRRATVVSPQDTDAWDGLCWSQILATHFIEARASCSRSLELDAENWFAALNLGHTWLLAGNLDNSWPFYRRALVGINNETQLRQVPLGQFEVFRRRGWRLAALAKATEWFQVEAPRLWNATELEREAYADYEQGRYAEALQKSRKVVSLREAVIGGEHPQIATDLNALGLVLTAAGRYEDAEPLYRRALAIDEKALRTGHPSIARDLNNLALLFYETGRYVEAEPIYRRALAVVEKAAGADPRFMARCLNNLGLVLNEMGRYSEAEPLYRRALAFAPEHEDAGNYFGNLATLLMDTGRYTEAESLLRQVLALDEKKTPLHPDVSGHLNNLAELLDITGRHTEAEPLYRKALFVAEQTLDSGHARVAIHLNNLAGHLCKTSRCEEAEPLFRRALAISERTLGPEHVMVAAGLNSVALLLYTRGQLVEALPMLYRAERIAVGSGALEATWRVQVTLQDFWNIQGQPRLAILWGKRALNTIQSIRVRLTNSNRDLQKSFLQDKKYAYRQITDALINQGRLGEAQLVLAALKEEEQFDYLLRNPDKDPRRMSLVYTNFERPWVERYDRESAVLGKLGAEHQALNRINEQVRTRDQVERLKVLNVELPRAQKKYETFIEELKVAFSQEKKPAVEFSAADTEQLEGLQRQLASLGHGAVAVQFNRDGEASADSRDDIARHRTSG